MVAAGNKEMGDSMDLKSANNLNELVSGFIPRDSRTD